MMQLRTRFPLVALTGLAVCLIVGNTGAAAVAETADAHSAAAHSHGLDDLAFMTGTWRSDFNGAVLEEHFTAPKHGTMVGLFRWMADDATTFTEHLILEERDDGVHFFIRHFSPGSMPWPDEVDGPLAFTLTEVEDGRAVFEAPERDFPTHIIYHRTQPDALVASLVGKNDDGTPRELTLDFRRQGMSTQTSTLTEVGESMGYDGGLTLAMHVKDLAKSMDWYQNVVGFKLVYHMEEMAWCELSTSVENVNVGLSQVEEPKVGGPTPTFGVKDIDHARQQLESHGVKFDGPTQEIPGMVKLATFYDPDGNSLMLYQTMEGMQQ